MRIYTISPYIRIWKHQKKCNFATTYPNSDFKAAMDRSHWVDDRKIVCQLFWSWIDEVMITFCPFKKINSQVHKIIYLKVKKGSEFKDKSMCMQPWHMAIICRSFPQKKQSSKNLQVIKNWPKKQLNPNLLPQFASIVDVFFTIFHPQ